MKKPKPLPRRVLSPAELVEHLTKHAEKLEKCPLCHEEVVSVALHYLNCPEVKV